MAILIDRTNEINRQFENRRRFIQRMKTYLSAKLKSGYYKHKRKSMKHGSVMIDNDSIKQPFFCFSYQNFYPEEVVINNKAFNKGDILEYPYTELVANSDTEKEDDEGMNKNSGEDEFEFILNESEYKELLFDGLVLPEFIEKDNPVVDIKRFKHGGFTKYGIPSNLNILKTYSEAFMRKVAHRGMIKYRIEELEQQTSDVPNSLELEELKQKLLSIPMFDEVDLRYNTRVPITRKITSAVYFCVMDVSGSMSENCKDLAKRLFYMIYLFLSTQYKETKIVFIIHTHEAYEVAEEEFFNTQINGATEFVPAYKMVDKIIRERYDSNSYNLYFTHVSDTDISQNDSEQAFEIFKNKIYPNMQYSFYIHTSDMKHLDPVYLGLQVQDETLLPKFLLNFDQLPKTRWSGMWSPHAPYVIMQEFFKK